MAVLLSSLAAEPLCAQCTLIGQEARLEIVDRESRGWGHVNIDQIEVGEQPRVGRSGPRVP